ncbi:M56 family metallopeptidase [Ulvibacterium sp.]|uniref:M56 family metallopeptidase n=1 Tax=Ulvibacterium sp. TaxID=2665914 RepID=UPI0026082E4F|nr:M56 family metallopeptidase [Ulvibacterium sp.]
MLVYFLKSSACLAFFLLFYKIFLEREKIHVFKRFYLLISLVLAFGIPLITFTEYIEVTTGNAKNTLDITSNAQGASETITSGLRTFYIPLFLWTIYLLGALFFTLRFARNLFEIVHRIRSNPKLKTKNSIHVLLWEKIVPHTFFNYIFLSKTRVEAQQIPREVLLHEETHVRQIHSLDIVLVELLQIFFWFNPLLLILKGVIKLNHEFLADQAVLDQGTPPPSYQNMLLAYTSDSGYGNHRLPMANAINYSSIHLTVFGKKITISSQYAQVKKRFNIMKRQTSKRTVLLKSTLVLPLLALLLYGFSGKKVIQTAIPDATPTPMESIRENLTWDTFQEYNALAKKYNNPAMDERDVKTKDILRMEHIYHRMSKVQKTNAEPLPRFANPLQESQEGATEEQVAQYNALAKKYNTMIDTQENIFIKKSDIELLEYLYSIMTEDQKSAAEPFPDFPEPPEPPVPPVPTVDEVVEIQKEVEKLASLLEEREVDIDVNQDVNEMIEVDIEINGKQKQMKQAAIALEKQRGKMEKESLKLQKQAQKMEKQGKLMEKESQELQKQARKLEQNIPPPPPPPEPESPLEFIKKMKKKNAIFYHERKKISADQAIELLKSSDHIKINSKGSKGNRPIVEISASLSQ